MESSSNEMTTADVMSLLISEGKITTLEIEQDSDGNILSVDKTNLHEDRPTSFISEPGSPLSPVGQAGPVLPSLTFESLGEAALHKIVVAFPRQVKGADIKTTRMFRNAFVGKAGVDWLEAKVPSVVGREDKNSCSRQVALQVAQWLLQQGHVWCCEGQKVKNEYVDDSPCYRHLAAVLLLDEPIPQDVVVVLLQKMKLPETGVPTKEEKILMKKVKGVFSEADLEQWIFKNVQGVPEKELSKVTKALLKKGLVEKVPLSNFLQFQAK